MNDNVLIYPNPTQDILNIEVKNPMNAHVKLISMDGKVVLEKTFSKEIQLDIRNQNIGNYLLIIENEGTMFEQKITKN